ncbi:MAG: hypothetical protein P4L00_04395 [Candidatus Acidoferrales bacterium]|nr:hypothetical protein [Candidatus Acidoferrales bacterium]
MIDDQRLARKEPNMMIIRVDYHPSDQYIAFADAETGEMGERRLNHRDGEAEKFYRELAARGVSVRVGIEATGTMQWFLSLMEELGIGPKRPGEGESGCRSQTRAPRVWAALCRTVSKGKSPQRSNLL